MTQDTGVAKLPGIPLLKTTDTALARWAQAVTEHLEVRAGARGNPLERVVTQRELSGINSTLQGFGHGAPTAQPGDLTIDLGGGMSASLSIEQFAKALRDSQLYKDLLFKLDDPARFAALPQVIQALVVSSIAEEASRRGASIQRLESQLQTKTESIAYKVLEVTAAVERASAGVREVTYAVAGNDRASAGKITQLQARLNGAPLDPSLILPTVYASLAALKSAVTAPNPDSFYQVTNPNPSLPVLLYRNKGNGWVLAGNGLTATLEDVMTVTADRITGLRAQRTIKVDAGGAVAGIGLAAESDIAGNGTSAIILRAGKLAFVGANDVVGTGAGQINPTNPDLARVPFGVDSDGNLFMRGTVRINAQGTILSDVLASTYKAYVFIRSASASFATAPSTSSEPTTQGWSNAPPAGSNPLYMSAADRKVTGNAVVGNWSVPVRLDGSQGNPGSPGGAGSPGIRGTRQLYRTGGNYYNGYGGYPYEATAAIAEATAGSTPTTPLVGDTVIFSNGYNYTTTYTCTVAGSSPTWSLPGVVIDGSLLVTGTITTSKIQAGLLDGFSLRVGNGNTGVTIAGASTVTDSFGNGISNGAYIYQNSSSLYGLYVRNFGYGGSAYFESNAGTTIDCFHNSYYGGAAGNFRSNSYSPAAVGLNAIGYHGARISNPDSSQVGLVGTSVGKCFYAEAGTFGPFTGAHDALLMRGTEIAIGDIVTDYALKARKGVNDTLFEVRRSSVASQKAAVGVLSYLSTDWSNFIPASLIDSFKTVTIGQSQLNQPVAVAGYADLVSTYALAAINALGEGQVNVCGQNGNIDAGDLIVCSDTPGKGMRQMDDLVRSTTVAKCREAVVFASPDEIKTVACIYLCG